MGIHLDAEASRRAVLSLGPLVLAGSLLAACGSDEPEHAAPPAERRGPRTPEFGVQFHGLWDDYWQDGQPVAAFDQDLDALQAAGVTLIRTDVGFSTSQPDPGDVDPEHYYNKRLARLVEVAGQRGLRVLWTVNQSPSWARPNTGDDVKQFPTDLDAWERWNRWFAERVGGAPGTEIEVWNEANLGGFTGVPEWERPGRYLPVLAAASRGIRAANPNVPIVLSGPSGTDDGFIKQVLDGGAVSMVDRIGVHPYNDHADVPPEATDRDDRTRLTHHPAVAALARNAGKPVQWTEIGIPVGGDRGVPDADTAGRYLCQIYDKAAEYGLPSVVFYAARAPRNDSMTLLGPDGRPLPHFQQLADHVRAKGQQPASRGGQRRAMRSQPRRSASSPRM